MADPNQIIRMLEKRALFEKGLTDVYQDEVKVLPQSWKEWLRSETATDWIKTDTAISGLGVMPERTIGSDFAVDRPFHGPTKSFQMRIYGLALVIQYEVGRWDLYGVYGGLAKELAKTASTRYDIIAYGVFNLAFSTSNSDYTDWYGEALCSATHTRFDGGQWKNRPSAALGLSASAFQTAQQDLSRNVNHRGKFAPLDPKRLVTTPENRWLANTYLMSTYNPDNANLAHNNARDVVGGKTLISPYISTGTFWFILCDPKDYNICMAKGDDPDLRSDNEPNTRNRIHTSYMSTRVETREGRGIYGDAGV